MKKFSWAYFLHIFIYFNFLVGISYAAVRVFNTPKSPYESMVVRRLYAFEAWIIIGFACIYFALTTWKKAQEKEDSPASSIEGADSSKK